MFLKNYGCRSLSSALICRLIALITVALAMSAPISATAQKTLSGPSSSSSGNSENSENSENKTAEPKKGSAWTLSFPMGLHQESTLDTLQYGYPQRSIPAMISNAYATTGNINAPGLNLIFFDRPDRSVFFFKDAIRHWIPAFDKQKFYNVYIPTTQLSYNFAGTRDNHQDRLRLDFAGNVNRQIGIGVMADYIHSKGCYENQAAKNFSFGASFYYTGSRYETQAFYNHYNTVNKENGGITDDLYILDPAVLQGGVDKIQPKSIPVRLSNAHSRLNGQQFFMTHAYKLGFWKDEQVNDTLTREVYVPVTKFIYSFDYSSDRHTFDNKDRQQAQEFWGNCYLNANATHDRTYFWEMNNAFGIYLIEGFQKWAKFGLAAFVNYKLRSFKLPTAYPTEEDPEGEIPNLTPMPTGTEGIEPRHKQHILQAGARLEKTQGAILRYRAEAIFGLSDDAAGDIDLKGDIDTRIPLFGDTVRVDAYGRFRNETPSWLLKNYVSNHFVWKNDFGKIRSFRVGGRLTIPWTLTSVNVGVENIQNHIYFNSNGMPTQFGGNVQVVSASLNQNFSFGIWNWNNTLTFQTSTNSEVLPLPKLSVYSNMFLKFTAFKVLHLQIGIDADYYTRYTGHNYQPATMAFTNQQEYPLGNFLLCNAYINAKLYKTRFYLLYSHVNQGWFGKQYFSLPHYPINPRRLQVGIIIDFHD